MNVRPMNAIKNILTGLMLILAIMAGPIALLGLLIGLAYYFSSGTAIATFVVLCVLVLSYLVGQDYRG